MKLKVLLIASLVAVVFAVASDKTADAAAIRSLTRPTQWLNSPGLSAEELNGKVVLVDFWTFTCVNWLRTLPYLRAWQEKYGDRGLVIVGVHSPEFSFEKDLDNVRRASQQLKVDYPIAVDSDHAIWRAYDNQYWPAIYLTDGEGRIQFRHFGETNYDDVERAIQRLLAKNGKSDIPSDLVAVKGLGVEAAADWHNLRSPENYLGYARTTAFASPESIARAAPRNYSIPRGLRLNSWALLGEWTMTSEFIQLRRPQGRIAYKFHARDVNLVMRTVAADRPVRFRVLIDGKPPGASHGADTDEQGNGTVSEPRLYQLLRQSGAISDREFLIEFLDENVEAYSFTFG